VQSLPSLPSHKDAGNSKINDLSSGVPMPSMSNTNKSPLSSRNQRVIGKTMGSKKPIKSTFEVHRNDSVIELLESKPLLKNASIPQLAPIKNLMEDETFKVDLRSKTPNKKKVDNPNQMVAIRSELNHIENKINVYQKNVTKISDAYSHA
jgi:hypothetical protein